MPPVTLVNNIIKTIIAQCFTLQHISISRLDTAVSSPSDGAVGVGKAAVWLTTFRTRSWKRTKRPTLFDAILTQGRCDPGSLSSKVLNVWTAPLRPLVLKPPPRLRPGVSALWGAPGGEGLAKNLRRAPGAVDGPRCWKTRSPVDNYNQISRGGSLQAPCELQHHLPRQ